MAILSDKHIKEYLDAGKIVIDPLDDPDIQIQPSSVDLRIGNEFKGFRIIRKPCIDPMDESDIDYVKYCAKVEADKAYIILDEFLNSLRLLGYQHTEKYKEISAAFVTLSIISRYGIEVFENNTDEHEDKGSGENDW